MGQRLKAFVGNLLAAVVADAIGTLLELVQGVLNLGHQRLEVRLHGEAALDVKGLGPFVGQMIANPTTFGSRALIAYLGLDLPQGHQLAFEAVAFGVQPLP